MTEPESQAAEAAPRPAGQSALSTGRGMRSPQTGAALAALLLSLCAGAAAYWLTRGADTAAAPRAPEAAMPAEQTLTLPPVPPLPDVEPAVSPESAESAPVAPPEPTPEERRLAAPLALGAGAAERPAPTSPPRQTNARSAAAPRRLANQSLTLPAGSLISCALATRIDTAAQGAALCRVTDDVWGADGTVLLIPRGSTLTGEFRGSAPRGLARIHLLWNELLTPEGIRMELGAGSSDALGGAGIPGEEDAHWWARFGNALFFSTLQDGFDYASARAAKASGGVNYYANTRDGLASLTEEAARDAGQIPVTVTVPQGTALTVITTRDVDFSTVYKLSSTGEQP